MGTRPNFVILPILSQFGETIENNLQHPFKFVGNVSETFPFKVTGDLDRGIDNSFMIINSYNVRDNRHKIILNEKSLTTHIEPVFDTTPGVTFSDHGPIPAGKFTSRMYILDRMALNDIEFRDPNTNQKGINTLRIERTQEEPHPNHGLGKNDQFRIGYITIFWNEDAEH